MEKKIEDYLHLYMGCDLHCGGELTPKKIQEFMNGERDNQLILRPLSDMTEEESNELDVWMQWFENSSGFKSWEQQNFSPDQFKKVLSRGFDLFNLIPEELAIDRTKLVATT